MKKLVLALVAIALVSMSAALKPASDAQSKDLRMDYFHRRS